MKDIRLYNKQVNIDCKRKNLKIPENQNENKIPSVQNNISVLLHFLTNHYKVNILQIARLYK